MPHTDPKIALQSHARDEPSRRPSNTRMVDVATAATAGMSAGASQLETEAAESKGSSPVRKIVRTASATQMLSTSITQAIHQSAQKDRA